MSEDTSCATVAERPKEVVFVAPALMGGGAERVACTLSGYCAERDIGFTFLLTKVGEVEYGLPQGVSLVDASKGGALSPLGQIRVIRRAMREHPEATFLSFLPHQNMYTVLAGAGLPNRVVVSVRNDPSYDFEGNRAMESVRNFLYARADAVVFQTHEEAKAFPTHVRGTFILNPLSPHTPDPYCGPREQRIVASGRLTAQKNYPMALRAFARFSEDHPSYTFDIFGAAHEDYDGPCEAELRALAAELGVAGRVAFRGFSPEANESIRTAAVFVMASRYEGLSNSMLEAMSMGMPCVCTRCGGGGPEMVIDDGANGFLVDVDDVEAMADRMASIIDNPTLSEQISKEAVKLRERIAVGVIGEQWLSVL